MIDILIDVALIAGVVLAVDFLLLDGRVLDIVKDIVAKVRAVVGL